jgi:hypothetical protein
MSIAQSNILSEGAPSLSRRSRQGGDFDFQCVDSDFPNSGRSMRNFRRASQPARVPGLRCKHAVGSQALSASTLSALFDV